MSGNVKIFANLKENFRDYDLLYVQPLSYIKAIINDNNEENQAQKIILLCKKVLTSLLYIILLILICIAK